MADQNKTWYNESTAKASKKYCAKFDDIKIRVPKGDKDYYKAAADRAGESLNQFTIRALNYLIELEKLADKKR